MGNPRPFALVRTFDQWLRSVHENTWLDSTEAVVSLAATSEPAPDAGGGAPLGGLAFDCECRLYHSLPADGRMEPQASGRVEPQASGRVEPQASGRVEWQLWSEDLGVAGGAAMPAPLDLVGGDVGEVPGRAAGAGEFAPVPASIETGLREPRGLAVDERDRLYVCETGAGRVLVWDLWSKRLIRRVRFGGARPLDAAATGRGVVVVTAAPDRLWRIEGRKPPTAIDVEPLASGPALAGASRVAVGPDGAIFVLCRPPAADRRILELRGAIRPAIVPLPAEALEGAADIELDGEGALVIAPETGDQLLRFRPTSAGGWEELPALKARRYDGGGIVRTPDGRIGYWTADGFRHALSARLRYERTGRVTTYRLDSGAFQTVWGRIFVDACIPDGTDVRVRCITADEPPEGETIPRGSPDNQTSATVTRPDLSPLLPAELAPGAVEEPLHRRETGVELPWVRPLPDDRFETYEAPVQAPPGRYLWVVIQLSGNSRKTPRIRSLRVEHPAHDWLRRLPKVFSREEQAAAFLRRYLHMPEGAFGELEARAAFREALVMPAATPAELLPWLAGFCGLVLDERWTEKQRRTLIAEVVTLFRLRGTVWGLTRFLEIVLEAPVYLLEHFKLRGYGGPIVGATDAGVPTRSVLGSGFRLGGALDDASEDTLGASAIDAFRKRAHRFTVLVARRLSTEERAMAEYVLAMHRPAHTVYDLCTVDAGMRVARGLLVGLTSIIGPSEGWRTAQLGFALGRGGSLVGRPEAGTTLGASRLGEDSRVG